jgi:hypothetical protein
MARCCEHQNLSFDHHIEIIFNQAFGLTKHGLSAKKKEIIKEKNSKIESSTSSACP